MKALSTREKIGGAVILLVSSGLLISTILFFRSCHVFYKKADILAIISTPIDEVVACALHGCDDSTYSYIFEKEENFIFEFEYWKYHKVKLLSDGSIFHNDKLLYQDREKVIDFLCRYAGRGVFTTSSDILYFREYLKNKRMFWVSHGHSHKPRIRISVSIGDEVLYDERFNLGVSELEFPEAKALSEMWCELRTFGEEGSELWDLLM
jgi:hypothetical protein